MLGNIHLQKGISRNSATLHGFKELSDRFMEYAQTSVSKGVKRNKKKYEISKCIVVYVEIGEHTDLRE